MHVTQTQLFTGVACGKQTSLVRTYSSFQTNKTFWIDWNVQHIIVLGAHSFCWFCHVVAQLNWVAAQIVCQLMRLWHFSSSVNSFLKHACAYSGVKCLIFVGPFVYFHTSRVRTAKALARLCGCASSPEPSLVAFVISNIISWAGPFDVLSLYHLYRERSVGQHGPNNTIWTTQTGAGHNF